MKTSAIFVIVGILAASAYFLSIKQYNFNLTKDNSSPQYNKTLSQRYGAYAKIAYCPESSIRNWNCKYCKQMQTIQDLQIISNTKREIFGYVFYDTQLKKIVLVWRGTIDFNNEVNDFSYAKIPYTCQGCQVHLGFYEGYRAVADEAYEKVQRLYAKYNVKIIVTGHSFGAALATISAIQINKKSPNAVVQLHNFGCPRIGNSKLADHITKEFPTLFRVVHNHDVFPHLPQQQQNYHHYPFQVLFDENYTNYQVCDDSGEDPNCSNSFSPNYNRADHHLYFYPMNATDC